MNIDSKFKEDEGTDNKESGKIDNNEQKPEDQVTSAKITTQEDGTDNKESGKSNDKISIKKEVFEDEEPGGSSPKYSFEDETCINYNTFDSDERRQPINTDESHTGGMRLRNFETLENTVNSRKRYQNQDEGLDDNELYLLKKIKTEDTSDDPFQEMWTNNFDHNSLNFEEWEKILNFVDEKNDIVNVRTVYTKFLGLYPLCYGYWKKYANFEKINNNMDEFEKVLEKGLIAIPISVDLWIYYMTYLRTNRSDEVVHIRNEFERSLKSCGLDYHSDQLWHDYISWEVEKTELYNAAQLYYRLICIPNSNYLNNFFEFQEFIFTKLPEQYLEHEEFNKRRNIIIQSLETTHNNIESSFYESIPPGEDFHKNTEFTEDRIMFLLRVGIINEWRDSHNATGIQFESRKIFEENIRRPHFHVNELDSNQIKNWDNYIKFERRIGRNHERIVYLYERCLINVCL
ncbi:pre-mRNA-processing factor 39-like [Acyrthosiphon pisum]|uniref:Uncharacterized protein n=1 Tax=Acyrthosiphon pisum TaxID=7029 RepID=A0A8R2D194_ACYPI|nr:pre-mRNA-processing factor 39-like [Acyrthosiphon pisum]XP_029347346.1 pre-mRNA-processing factor 39-like [Acyrthosiphon pisum]|eukprot:XP_016656267.1 PREDICTED: pre-mRNA-processing factor 39-like [Acyrthosiphon pisum]